MCEKNIFLTEEKNPAISSFIPNLKNYWEKSFQSEKKVKSPAYFMYLALRESLKGAAKGEIPVGAIIVRNNEIIARAYNTRERQNKALGHAEIEAIIKANKKLNSWRLNDCEMYVTLEPCYMCAAAIWQARLKKVYFAAFDKKAGALVSCGHFFDEQALFHRVDYEAGILADESAYLLKSFFKILREEKKQRKMNKKGG